MYICVPTAPAQRSNPAYTRTMNGHTGGLGAEPPSRGANNKCSAYTFDRGGVRTIGFAFFLVSCLVSANTALR